MAQPNQPDPNNLTRPNHPSPEVKNGSCLWHDPLPLQVTDSSHYQSTLGFTVLHYQPSPEVPPACMLPTLPPCNLPHSPQVLESFLASLSSRLSSVPRYVVPAAVLTHQPEVVEVPQRVADPVVVVVGAPGHGRSSVANLILGEERFRVRGRDVMVEDSHQVGRGGESDLALHVGGGGPGGPEQGDGGGESQPVPGGPLQRQVPVLHSSSPPVLTSPPAWVAWTVSCVGWGW